MHLASLDQQRELMRYMTNLNDWLDRDVNDRQDEMRGVSARVSRLSDDINRLANALRPQGPFLALEVAVLSTNNAFFQVFLFLLCLSSVCRQDLPLSKVNKAKLARGLFLLRETWDERVRPRQVQPGCPLRGRSCLL